MAPLATADSIFGLPVALMDGLIGALLGGLLTVVGGFLATMWQAKQEEARSRLVREREEDEQADALVAAIRIVRYELAADAASLASFLKYARLPRPLTDASFRSVQLVIARRLNPELRLEVVKAFNMLPIGMDAAMELSQVAMDKWPHEQREAIELVVKDLDDAGLALRKHLIDDLKVSEV
jgi:hypothetical protein